jgi:hypothetical protein
MCIALVQQKCLHYFVPKHFILARISLQNKIWGCELYRRFYCGKKRLQTSRREEVEVGY